LALGTEKKKPKSSSDLPLDLYIVLFLFILE